MKNNWDIEGYLKKLEKGQLQDAFNVIGMQSVTWASDNFRKRGYSPATKKKTGNMIQNLSYATKSNQSNPDYGRAINKPNDPLELNVGGNVVYLARYEMGFIGTDSLGRVYNQKARPILKDVFKDHKTDILKIFQSALNSG